MSAQVPYLTRVRKIAARIRLSGDVGREHVDATTCATVAKSRSAWRGRSRGADQRQERVRVREEGRSRSPQTGDHVDNGAAVPTGHSCRPLCLWSPMESGARDERLPLSEPLS